jgi:hypothetical protein
VSQLLEKASDADVLALVAKEMQRRRWRKYPDEWVKEKLKEHMWSQQQRIIRSIQEHRKTLAMTCHGIGKSWAAGRAAAHWLDTLPIGKAFVVTSAPSTPQIKAILWREIGRAHAIGNLGGRMNQTEWYMTFPGGKEELVAFGRKPDDYDPAAFQGIHARYVLVILDEANGIRGPLHEAAESLIANDYGRMLLIGNPDDPAGEFYEMSKPGSGVNVIQIGAFDTPNFTGEEIPEELRHDLIGRLYVEEKRRKQAPKWFWVDRSGNPSTPEEGVRVVPPDGTKPEDINPIWSSKILGLFPHISEENALIPLSWIYAAQQRSLQPGFPNTIGLDVGAGGDASVGCNRRGPVFRILWEDHNPDTMATKDKAVEFLTETGAEKVQVDVVGIGKGVVDQGKAEGKPFEGINVGEHAEDKKRFLNLRAEIYWAVRELFEKGNIDIDADDEDLAAELASIRYFRTAGKIQIESKRQAKDRGVPSPNRAEALVLASAKARKKLTKATWGKRRTIH